MNVKDLKVKIYADGANIEDMLKAEAGGFVTGFTTNPSLMKQAGVKNYNEFAKEALTKLKYPISFEVFADDLETMEKEAEIINSFGENVYIKIPIINTKGESTKELIKKLSAKGYKLNITAILTIDQVKDTVEAFAEGTSNLVSVFAGRIADAGFDPLPIMKEARKICDTKQGTELLWASTRELYNVIQADEIGADIITAPPAVISKLGGMGKDLFEISLDTVKTFAKDIEASGLSIR
ncbi:MAG: transaldolase [Defluviitaleaceae bacterium]|nr:transaldolase [Defluviitaleaceae bacterium]